MITMKRRMTMMRHSLIRFKCQQSRLWRPCFITLSSSRSVDVVHDICFGVTFSEKFK